MKKTLRRNLDGAEEEKRKIKVLRISSIVSLRTRKRKHKRMPILLLCECYFYPREKVNEKIAAKQIKETFWRIKLLPLLKSLDRDYAFNPICLFVSLCTLYRRKFSVNFTDIFRMSMTSFKEELIKFGSMGIYKTFFVWEIFHILRPDNIWKKRLHSYPLSWYLST